LGGHRHLTHAVLGVAGFEFLAWLAAKFRHEIGGKAGMVALLSLIIAGGLYAFGMRGHVADLAAIGAAIGLVVTGTGLSHVATAVGVGCATHVVGDMLTGSRSRRKPLAVIHADLVAERYRLAGEHVAVG
jgi:LexA-binding, inner membrane-associated putative hydrolase